MPGYLLQVALDQQSDRSTNKDTSRQPSATAAAGGSSAAPEAQQSTLKFVDRDEHVYFWFPLLAGLSELTFDPRVQIRRSALEVRCLLGAAMHCFL